MKISKELNRIIIILLHITAYAVHEPQLNVGPKANYITASKKIGLKLN
jgi:hypothetical protein